MGEPDPLLYPLPSGSSGALRQEIARTRAQLGETLEALGRRVDPVHQARAILPGVVVRGSAVGVLAVMGGLLFGRRHRAVGILVGAIAGTAAVVVLNRRRDRRPETVPAAPPAEESPRAEEPAVFDIVDLLLGQHRQIEAAFTAAKEHGIDRLERFAALIETLKRARDRRAGDRARLAGRAESGGRRGGTRPGGRGAGGRTYHRASDPSRGRPP
jgi:hypothetical protein